MFDCAHPESLVSAQWITDHPADPVVSLVEVIWGDSGEWGAAAYRSGDVSGASAGWSSRVRQDDVRQALGRPGRLLVNTRSPELFR